MGTGSFDYRVLMQKRGRGVSRAGMFTFPGGVADPSDSDLKETVVRELFEEAGILLAKPGYDKISLASNIQKWRGAVHQNAAEFKAILSAVNAYPSYNQLHHYCTFLTPNFEQRKYITHFFLSTVSREQLQFLEADGGETASLRWLTPQEGLDLSDSGMIELMPPQYYVMKRLSSFKTTNEVLSSFRPRIESVFTPGSALLLTDERGFPAMHPHPLTSFSTEKLMVLSLPKDELHDKHPGPPGSRHRLLCPLPIGSPGYVLEYNIPVM